MKIIKRIIVERKILFFNILTTFLTICIMYETGLLFTNSYFVALLVYMALYMLVAFGSKEFRGRNARYSLLFSVPFGVAYWFGHKIINQSLDIGAFYVWDICIAVAFVVIFALVSSIVFHYLDGRKNILESGELSKKRWGFYAIIILCCWIPFFLIFFPGQISVDSAVMVSQIIGEENLSNWHPVLYVGLISLPIKIGFNLFHDLTFGLALAVIMQMLILSVIFGYVSYWVIKKTGKNVLGYLFIAFFALCPIVSCYSITLWKDVLFAAIFLLFTIKTYDFISVRGRGDTFKIREILYVVALVVLLAFLRNGGVLIVFAFGVALFVYYVSMRRMIGMIFGFAILAIFLIQGPFYNMLGISKSPFMESMSIPSQQMAYVAYSGGLSEDEKNELSVIADVDEMKEKYTPMNADPAKNSFDYEAVEENKGIFLRNWWNILQKHFIEYIKAYILHTYSYWYVEGYSWALSYEHNHDKLWLQEDYNDVPLLGEDTRNFVERLEHKLMSVSLFGWIGNVGVMFWLTIFVTFIYLYQKKNKLIILTVCPLAYLFSLLLASPVSGSFRYVYSVLLVLPILLLLCFIKKEDRIE